MTAGLNMAKNVREEEGMNTLVAFVVSDEEASALNKIADYYGVSIAQVARGFFRVSFSKQSLEGSLPAVRLGKMIDAVD